MRPLPTRSPEDAQVWLKSERKLWIGLVDEAKIDLSE
jgi:hypothetical protein